MHRFVLCRPATLIYPLLVACTATQPELKCEVTEFWNSSPCGFRYVGSDTDFESHAHARYQLEPHIAGFAGFTSSRGLRVLEIGVGIGADYEQWLKHGALATGIDLSETSLNFTRVRCEKAGLKPDLYRADAENLPFQANTFNVVYSYGVMHHSADTAKCLNEAWRVLKPGGQARVMLYHHASITGFMLWLRYGLWRGLSLRRCVYEKLESPGTKSFTRNETLALMRNFVNVRFEQVFSPGDLLLHVPSQRFRGPGYRILWRLFPRSLVRRLGKRWGLFLLISADKP